MVNFHLGSRILKLCKWIILMIRLHNSEYFHYTHLYNNIIVEIIAVFFDIYTS